MDLIVERAVRRSFMPDSTAPIQTTALSGMWPVNCKVVDGLAREPRAGVTSASTLEMNHHVTAYLRQPDPNSER